MSRIRWFVLLLLAAVLPTAAVAQQSGIITGRVTDARTGAPLADVTVTVTGANLRTLTNAEGTYRISGVPTGSREISANRIGYSGSTSRVSVAAGQTATANLSLSVGALALNAVVVQANGREARQREIGSDVGTISAAQVPQATVQNVSQFIQGRAAGVVVLPATGQLGAGSRIRIRGSNSLSLGNEPLIIIDGVRVASESKEDNLFTGGQSTSRVEDMNPDDIENIEILKGPAATALYGTQAANGVIQITTKRGRAGRTTVRAFSEFGTQKITSDLPVNYLARGRNAGGAIVTCDFVARAAHTCVSTTVDSIYQYSPLTSSVTPIQTGATTRLGGSVSGGSENATYYVSGETEHGTGVQRPNHLGRNNVRANLGGMVGKSMHLNASAGYTQSDTQLPQSDNSAVSPFLMGLEGSPSPTNVANNGGYGSNLSPANLFVWQNYDRISRFTGSITSDWRPLSWLSFNGTAGVDDTNRFNRTFVAATDLPAFFPGGFREQYRLSSRVFTANAGTTATFDLRKNIASTTSAGVQWNSNYGDWTYAEADEIAPGTITGSIPGAVQENLGPSDVSKLFGTYITQQFAINDRLFLTGGLRGDKTSSQGADIGFVTYPSLSASWVVNEEPFFPQISALSNLRLRASYGKAGLRPDRLAALRTYDTFEATVGGDVIPGFVVSNLGNSQLKAEVTREIEFGADLGLFNNRVSLEATHYNKKSNNALVLRSIAPSFGGPTSQYFNLGSVENKGNELTLRTQPIQSTRVRLGLGATLTQNHNKLLTFGDTTVAPISVTAYQYHVPGYSLGGYWAKRYTFSDTNGDGLIQTGEITIDPAQDNAQLGRSYMGSPFPKTELGFNADLSLFQWVRVTALLDHKGGQKLYNNFLRARCAGNSTTTSFCEMRQVPGVASLADQAAIQAYRQYGSEAGFIEDASFTKLREVSVTLTSPASLVRRLGLPNNGLSLTLGGRNLKTWTNYRGLDPEVNFNGASNFSTADFFTIPPARQLTARIDVNF